MLLTILLAWFVISIPVTLIIGIFLALGSKNYQAETVIEREMQFEADYTARSPEVSLKYVN